MDFSIKDISKTNKSKDVLNLTEEENKLLHYIISKLDVSTDDDIRLWALQTSRRLERNDWYEPLLIGARYIKLLHTLKLITNE